jgi:5'-deoxynucleotidase YfbR-like HD superfamily hydrolase
MKRSKTLGEIEIIQTTKAVVELGDLAMKFGRVNRTCVVHPTGEPESDTDHTVMLSWIAPALAEIINLREGYERYPVGKVTQYCVVHDAVEVVVGDTATHKITPEAYAAKELREAQGADHLYNQFIKRLPWFARMVRSYESQSDPVARFVRSVDKIMPKIVHVLNAATDLVRAGLTYEDFVALYERQRAQIENWCPEPLLLQLYDELCGEVGRQYGTAVLQPVHFLVVVAGQPSLEHYCASMIDCPLLDPFNAFRTRNLERLRDGKYPVELREGQLTFIGSQEN